MTQLRKRALWSLGIFVPVMLVFLAVFFSDGGPETFAQSRARKVAVAGLFLAGYGSFFAMLYATRTRSTAGPVITDERDAAIASRANGVALIAVMVFVYVVSTALWTVFEPAGALPSGWMQFLAYATVFFGLLAHASATLILDGKAVLRGEG